MITKLDFESLLLTSIFQEAHPMGHLKEDPVSVTEYLKYCASDIERLGRVFKFLGLAEESKESILGWKPTGRLIQIIGERSARVTRASEKTATKNERKLVESLYQLAGGQAEEYIGDDFVFRVLNGLGLLQEDRVGGGKPTSLLQETVIAVFQAE